MPSISKIILKNIKFFHDETIKINKNILFYGENGSGKSSLYWALKIYFEHLAGIISAEKKMSFLIITIQEIYVIEII
jgi:predicted ATPase